MNIDTIKQTLKRLNYAFFDNGKPHNLNLIGIRNSERRAGYFDDTFIIIYRNRENKEVIFTFPCTTDPSDVYLQKPLSGKGTAIVVPGQYRGLWKIGVHANKYTALVQAKPIKVYRDNNKDNIINTDNRTIEEGIFGINLHRAGLKDSNEIGLYSAGCQVLEHKKDFDFIIKACQVSADNFGNSFTYTLLTQENIKNNHE